MFWKEATGKGRQQQNSLSNIFIALKTQANSAWKLENTVGTFSEFVSITYRLYYLASAKTITTQKDVLNN